jgi:hypothetical protein
MLLAPAFIRDGKLYLLHRDELNHTVSLWPDCRVTLALEQAKNPRSLALNAYWWAVCVHHVSEETGYRPQDVHDMLKELHLPRRLHAMRRGPICWRCARVIGGTTTTISNDEMQMLCADTQEWAANALHIHIPDPNQTDVVAA